MSNNAKNIDTGLPKGDIPAMLNLCLIGHLAGVPVLLQGPPGVAKSALIRAYHRLITESVGEEVAYYDHRLSSKLPHQVGGLTYINKELEATVEYPVVDMPLQKWVDKGMSTPVSILSLEEATDCEKATSLMLYRLLWEKQCGNEDLSPYAGIFLTCNLLANRAAAKPLSSAICNRLAMMEFVPDLNSFMIWGSGNTPSRGKSVNIGNGVTIKVGNDYGARDILADHNFGELIVEVREMLDTTQPIHPVLLAWVSAVVEDGKAHPLDTWDAANWKPNTPFQTRRSFESLNRMLKVHEHLFGDIESAPLLMYQANVGMDLGASLYAWVRSYGELPSTDDIYADPTGIPVPDKSGHRLAITHLICHRVAKGKTGKAEMEVFAKFIERMPVENQAIAWRTAMAIEGSLVHETAAFRKHAKENQYIYNTSN